MITSFLLFFILPFVSAQEIPDYNNPYAPILFDKPFYTWTDKVGITIVAPSWNADRYLIDSIGDESSHTIKISTRDFSLDQYRLTETDVNSGVFKGEVILTGFSHDADGDGDVDTNPRTFGNGPTNGFLETEQNSAITVSFEFADGIVLTESAPITWNQSAIKFSQENYVEYETAIIRVVDLDMNLNPEAIDQIPIDVSSDSDTAGIRVSAVETSENSGMFEVAISFTQNSFSSGNRLFTMIGDTLYAKYDDHTLPKPYTTSDSLEIQSTARVDSSVPAMERIQTSGITISDGGFNKSTIQNVNQNIYIGGTVTNSQNFTQKFVYIVQIKDHSNTIVSLSWLSGQLTPNQNFEVSQSWLPTQIGEYTVDTFVWESLNTSATLSSSNTIQISIQNLPE